MEKKIISYNKSNDPDEYDVHLEFDFRNILILIEIENTTACRN